MRHLALVELEVRLSAAAAASGSTSARERRLLAAVGPHCSSEIDPEEQVELTLALLREARKRRVI